MNMEKQTIYEILGFVLAFLGLGIGYMAVYLGIRHDRYKRELEHKERMTALELGRSLPGEGSWLAPGRLGFLIAVLVPSAAFLFAWLASREAGYQEMVWTTAGMVGIFSVVSGSLLAGTGLMRQGQLSQPANIPASKPAVEDDAYDVVSARG
jgi:hypothetical protein